MGTTNIKLEGRKNEPTITISGVFGPEFRIKLKGAELTTRTNGRGVDSWQVKARHDNGTDFEHDAASVAILEGVALQFQYMQYGEAHFTGYLLEGSWYDSGTVMEPGMEFPHSSDNPTVEVCEDTEYYHPEGATWKAGHLLMPYTPPKRKVEPREVSITVSYRRFIPED